MTSATLSSWKERSRTSSLAAAMILARTSWRRSLAGGAVAFVGAILLHSVTHRVMIAALWPRKAETGDVGADPGSGSQ